MIFILFYHQEPEISKKFVRILKSRLDPGKPLIQCHFAIKKTIAYQVRSDAEPYEVQLHRNPVYLIFANGRDQKASSDHFGKGGKFRHICICMCITPVT
jgi:hypothetical protein